MLTFNCPSCTTTLELPESARGARVVCGHCGESVFVAGGESRPRQSESYQPQPKELHHVQEFSRPIRRRKQPNPLAIVPHLVIAGVTCFAAWKMFDATVNRPVPQQVAVKPSRPIPRRINPKRTLPPKVQPHQSPPKEPSPPKVEAVSVMPERLPAFSTFPKAVTLPAADDDQLSTIAETHSDSKIALLTNAQALTLDDEKLLWNGKLVAGIRSEKGKVQFRWVRNVPPEAEAGIRNSLLHLAAGNEEHWIALREPVVGEPLLMDLQSATQRINCKCDWLPPSEQIRVSIDFASKLPVKEVDGANLDSLRMRDEAIVTYQVNQDIATKVTIKPVGEVVAAILQTQYVLPSGDVEQLSKSRGTRVMNQLLRLQEEATNAVAALPRLQRYRVELGGDLRQAQRIPTGSRMAGGGYVENPVMHGQKDQAIRRIQGELLATERNIARARQLSDAKPSIDGDVRAMQRIDQFAKSIHEQPLAYRFFIVVGGREIDLINWAPAVDPIGGQPAIHAIPMQ